MFLAGLETDPGNLRSVGRSAFLVATGGVIVPLAQLPGPIAALAGALPPALMADLVRAALTAGAAVAPGEALALGGWTVVLLAATLATFRVDEG